MHCCLKLYRMCIPRKFITKVASFNARIHITREAKGFVVLLKLLTCIRDKPNSSLGQLSDVLKISLVSQPLQGNII